GTADAREGGDPLLELTNGVLPAIEKAVALAVADPERVFVLGQSYGGYSTYGLITQTQRFKAAVAMAGYTDLVSIYGTFDARKRYMDHAHEAQGSIGRLEMPMGQPRIGNPPWRDMGRYLRNSPIAYVDRVETPILLIHGDIDFVPMQQAE